MLREKGGIFYEPSIKKIDLFVIRINKTGEMCNARPCYNCLNMMKAVGIRKVYYSVSDTQIISENVKNMVSIQISSVSLHLEKAKCKIKFKNNIEYYQYLLLKLFPKEIRLNNLEKFIKYNLNNLLPQFTVRIKNDKIHILNDNNHTVISSILI